MDRAVLESIENVVNYNWSDEYADYCENPSETHILVDLIRLRFFVLQQKGLA